ncbi:Ankyrin repeat domain containing protein [Pandoravirus quercus]|uniref:Ankyrin repeat domain containing protein n=1 Tax=Pandoravirus quercus TaxID=2107709 RepID=A0A2U7UA48_9VIRU|nr:Ankyrin repeat domain containing protein [Pandoravirus quercus]AVK75321.1 Ankyrin repeat domain containing protein [Pandoravirus quercus]
MGRHRTVDAGALAKEAASTRTTQARRGNRARGAGDDCPPHHECKIASLPAVVIEAVLERLDDADLAACVAAHRCFCDAARPRLSKTRRIDAWIRRGPLWACATNNVDALTALAQRGVVFRQTHLIEATRCGHLDAVTFLCQKGIVTDDPTADANKTGGDVAEDDHKPIEYTGPNPTALDVAAANGHGAIVRFLHANLDGTRVATTAAMDQAAEHGHLDIVVFLHENRTEGCTECAMDWAAANGHTAIVAYLHEHRTEGCTPWAMNAAATNGHLRTVAYLHEHRNEGCTTDAMDGAAANGHEDVIIYLDRHRDEGCTGNARIDACLGGHDHILLLMEERGIVPGRRHGRRRRRYKPAAGPGT